MGVLIKERVYQWDEQTTSTSAVGCTRTTASTLVTRPSFTSQVNRASRRSTRESLRTPMDEFLKGGELKIRRYGVRDDADTTMSEPKSGSVKLATTL